MTAQEVGGTLLLMVGTALIALASIGLVRLPDAFNRANAVTKAAGLGVVCVILAVIVLDPRWDTAVPLLIAAALQLFTVPVAGVAIGEAAWRSGTPLAEGTQVDLRGRARSRPQVTRWRGPAGSS